MLNIAHVAVSINVAGYTHKPMSIINVRIRKTQLDAITYLSIQIPFMRERHSAVTDRPCGGGCQTHTWGGEEPTRKCPSAFNVRGFRHISNCPLWRVVPSVSMS